MRGLATLPDTVDAVAAQCRVATRRDLHIRASVVGNVVVLQDSQAVIPDVDSAPPVTVDGVVPERPVSAGRDRHTDDLVARYVVVLQRSPAPVVHVHAALLAVVDP